MEPYRHLSIEEAEKLAKEVYNRYKAEVDKKWEQFKREMEGVPPEILYDPDMWDEWMVDRWVELIDEIPSWDMEEEYWKKGIWVWIEHEEDIVVTVRSSCFEVEVRNGEVEVHPYGGFREWKYSENWNRERHVSIRWAWEGFARLFFPWELEENKWLYRWDIESWLELEVYKDLLEKDAWKESSYLDVVEFSKFGTTDEVPSLLQFVEGR
ncbi:MULTISPECIES: hypothetical protein [unclassified Thermococcus]|uniref:hypothetical protein n=1 Tax=unclassified Thermococcus TaxID=2627626 RepID=UPI00197D7994|nr:MULTISPECIES: hypothetical protein [unclassified Thermococcus]